MSDYPKKLIEVSIPLQEINEACVREKSLRYGHPSTLHLWWARRPLAAARAVLFAQLVDDPSGYADELGQNSTAVKAAEKTLGRKHRGAGDLAIEGLLIAAERERLFDIIRRLVIWENTNNDDVLDPAREEIRRSWRRHLKREQKPLDTPMPPVLDPFAGGGAIPLEAQRLGMEAHASDLNPVAILINRAMIEIPPKFSGFPPVNANWQEKTASERAANVWKRAQGLAEDVRYYGQWIREEAERRIGKLYPSYTLTDDILDNRPELPKVGYKPGDTLTVIAWLWARTVPSPNPALEGRHVPLVSSYWLSRKKGKEAYIQPVVENGAYRFEIRLGLPDDPEAVEAGTKEGTGSNFRCILSGVPMSGNYIKERGKRGEMDVTMMAVVCEGKRNRVYLTASDEHIAAAKEAKPTWAPSGKIPPLTGGSCVPYGMDDFGKLFSPRQLVALTTLSDLVQEAREQVLRDGESSSKFPDDSRALEEGGHGLNAYADAVALYLSFAVSRAADRGSSICSWDSSPKMEALRNTFGRQAIPMTWDFAEGNHFSRSSGNFTNHLEWGCKFLEVSASCHVPGFVSQENASVRTISRDTIISSDPPYYDNIGYADLSDFFYVWLRRSLRQILPVGLGSILVPKEEELIASTHRHGSKSEAERFFLDGMRSVAHRWSESASRVFPATIYYAFKQAEIKKEGLVSTGWAVFLSALIEAGYSVVGTWPMRTEMANKIGSKANMLASSIVLVCRQRQPTAEVITKRQFIETLQSELPSALRELQHANLSPVDLPQSSIGPGMAIFSRYQKIIKGDGESMGVSEALQLINHELSGILDGQVSDMDSDTRFAVAWFSTYGFKAGKFGDADNLGRAYDVSVDGVAHAGILESAQNKVRIFRAAELSSDWNPEEDDRLTVWEVVHHLIRLLETEGEQAAATILGNRAIDSGNMAENARALCYRLYTICEQNKWADDATSYNGLISAWPELLKLSQTSPASYIQGDLI